MVNEVSYNAFEDRFNNPDEWVERTELARVLGLDKSKDKFNKYLKDIEKLDDSYLYVQGTLNTNKVFNKKRVYNYINHINRLRDRGC